MPSISLNFNPRSLVATHASPLETSPVRVDAVYVPTRRRPKNVRNLLHSFAGCQAPVFVLPSSPEDLPPTTLGAASPVQVLSCEAHSEFMGVVGSLRTSSNPLFAISSIEWDLPLKRSFALWHAAMNRHARILLLDDDILGIDAPLLSAGTDALSTSPVAGPFVEDYPDTSVIGHVKIALGDEVLPFLSGSCLFVNCAEPRGFFPQIYNEDWLFMAPYVAIGMVCSLGHVAQMPYDPFANPLLARFQEPGEAIADGIFALLSANRYCDRFDSTVWESLLSARSQWLKDLAARTALPSHRLALDTALERFRDIRAKECAQYIRDLDHDRVQWHRQVLEVMK